MPDTTQEVVFIVSDGPAFCPDCFSLLEEGGY